MALADGILASVQQINLDARIGGVQVDAQEVSVSLGITQANSQCTITMPQLPSTAAERQEVIVYAGYNGDLAQLFGGEYTGVAWSYFPGRIELSCRDRLALAQFAWSGTVDRVYISQDDAAVIRNLLEAMGLPSYVASIESSGWTLGNINPVTCKVGDIPFDIVRNIDQVAGYRTFVRGNGSIYRRRVSGDTASTPVWTCQQGQDIISIKRRRSIEGIKNQWKVTGYTYLNVPVQQTAQATSAYIPTPPQYVGDTLQSELIETDAKALAVAQRLVSDTNRRIESYELEVIGNPLIQPADTIGIIHSGVSNVNSMFLVDTVTHRVTSRGYRTTIQTWQGGK